VNQPTISLFMATIGLAFVIEGLAQGMWGTQVHGLNIGIPDDIWDLGGVFVGPFFGGAIESGFPYMLALFFLLIRPEGLFGEERIERV
jgi:branched-chain amino acid transport system permease protein